MKSGSFGSWTDRWAVQGMALMLFIGLFSSGILAGEDPAHEFQWSGPEGRKLPFRTHEEMERFLAEASVTAIKDISTGITKPKKLTLEKDGIRMHGIFRYVDIYKDNVETRKGIRPWYRDAAVFELASYRLSRLLGIDAVPPVVGREFSASDLVDASLLKKLPRRDGTLQAWVEGAMTEGQRIERGVSPPDYRRWSRQMHMMRLFDNLIFNDDRNLGNILIGPDWKVWFIDSTRAFRPFGQLRDPEEFIRCDREVFQRLLLTSDEEMESALRGLLTQREVSGLLKRLNELREHLEAQISAHGEQVVLFEAAF